MIQRFFLRFLWAVVVIGIWTFFLWWWYLIYTPGGLDTSISLTTSFVLLSLSVCAWAAIYASYDNRLLWWRVVTVVAWIVMCGVALYRAIPDVLQSFVVVLALVSFCLFFLWVSGTMSWLSCVLWHIVAFLLLFGWTKIPDAPLLSPGHFFLSQRTLWPFSQSWSEVIIRNQESEFLFVQWWDGTSIVVWPSSELVVTEQKILTDKLYSWSVTVERVRGDVSLLTFSPFWSLWTGQQQLSFGGGFYMGDMSLLPLHQQAFVSYLERRQQREVVYGQHRQWIQWWLSKISAFRRFIQPFSYQKELRYVAQRDRYYKDMRRGTMIFPFVHLSWERDVSWSFTLPSQDQTRTWWSRLGWDLRFLDFLSDSWD